MRTFSESVKPRHLLPVATSNATRTSASIDVRGYGGLAIVLHCGVNAAAATGSIKVQASNDNATWADLAGPTFALGAVAADLATVWDIVRPQHRYYRVVKTATNSENSTQGVIAYLYRPSREPVPPSAGVSPDVFRFVAPQLAS